MSRVLLLQPESGAVRTVVGANDDASVTVEFGVSYTLSHLPASDVRALGRALIEAANVATLGAESRRSLRAGGL